MGKTEEQPAGDSAAERPRRKDIQGAAFSDIDWSDRRAAIDRALNEVREKARTAEGWYRDKKGSKAAGAVFLRVTAITAGILSGIWPILFNALAVMFPVSTHPNVVDFRLFLPLSAVFVIVAGGCVSLDVYFGFSSGWIRYVVTFQTLQSLSETFELTWPRAVLRFPKTGDIPDDIYLAALDAILAFTRSINDTIRDETSAWATDFKEALKGMGESIEKQRAAAVSYTSIVERGAVTVTVTGLERADDQKWTLEVGGQIREIHGSATGTTTGLAPGLTVVCARARIGGADVAVEKTVTVEPAKCADVAIALGAPPVLSTGILLVAVTGAADLDGHTWTLTVNGGEPKTILGASTEVVERVLPGVATVRVAGARAQKPLAAAGTVTIEAGKSATLTLSLG
ncbi:MAG: SLATT domain-containing protein [Polyangiaceae bacterium]